MTSILIRIFFLITMIYISIKDISCGGGKKDKKGKKHKNSKKKVLTIRDRINQALFDQNDSNYVGDKKNKDKKNNKKNITTLNNYDLTSLRKLDNEYIKTQEKRDKRSILDIKKNDLVSPVTIIRKEIILSDNEDIFERDGILFEKLFADVKNKKIKIYSDSRLETEMNYEDLNKKLIKPINLESKRRRNEQRKFRFLDIDSIIIEEHLFWTKQYPSNILDKITVTFVIPQSRTGTIENIIVCHMGYHDFIKFLDDNKIIINNKRMKTTFSNAIEKDKLNFMYKSIVSDDRDYSFDTDTYDKNIYSSNKILAEIKENHFAYNQI